MYNKWESGGHVRTAGNGAGSGTKNADRDEHSWGRRVRKPEGRVTVTPGNAFSSGVILTLAVCMLQVCSSFPSKPSRVVQVHTY